MKTIIAIDPGRIGGIAVQCPGTTAYAIKMPDTQGDVLNFLKNLRHTDQCDHAETICVLEQVGGFAGKGQPGSSMFKFGEGFGFIKGVVQALGIKLILVRPQEWQKTFGVGTKRACATKTEWKNKLKALAQRLYPGIEVTLATADALLILEWARQQPSCQ